ncbi:MAG: hypothetical protein LKG79_11690 [Furfurilactobacillus sp.]|jgi:hypothetical protein|uniref:Uncharacterized protein n=2 Tax=Furfurilactobacillus TaxID=2767882 RepID=A0A6N9I5A2_9LACO|nr:MULTISPECIES: hypothetical protein [Furfurilactobacillus]QLE66216.1 hypothetical protein LROSL2_0865 [Furfurilactobacillus rossiae]MCF6161998.1 hypothetical protein [Furfurilactobacillus milii]MCF6164378.1 hypothetical protein [Furfurilactobacillus milii]MCF6420590.1 hypothetical protein [Furfurilactobacillus milii]MCH4011071.1 hypothetical protein [Furfurilactobacillus sp.]
MKQVAGTILTINDGTPSFLVTKNEGNYGFFCTKVLEDKTALASILECLHDALEVDLEQLRLSELTTCEIAEANVSLFVFDHLQITSELKQRALEQGLDFVQGDQLHTLFHDVKFDSAPVFD